MSDVVQRVAAVVGAAFAAWIAYHAAGADGAPGAAHTGAVPDVAPGASAGRGAPSDRDAYEVTVRLLERMSDAQVEAPNLALRGPLLAYHRKSPVAWAALSPAALKLTASVALRAGAAEAPGAGKAAALPAADGVFEQREAIALPTPATVTFKVAVPPAGRFEFATALLGGRGETVFTVSILDAQGRARDVFTRSMPALAGKDQARWADAEVDLSPWGGQWVELKLRAVPKLVVSTKEGLASVESTSSAVALWGNPTVLGKGSTVLPYNVLWIVSSAFRADVLASFHDTLEDEARAHAKTAPLEAWLPVIPGLTPNVDALAARGVRFTRAYANGTWIRPGALALMAGARATELGIDPARAEIDPSEAARFYASEPPLLPLAARRAGAHARAFVSDPFLAPYTGSGLDLGFERVEDRRHRGKEPAEITASASAWLQKHAGDRFFVLCNYDMAREPYEVPAAVQARIPPPPAGPADARIRLYMAAAAKIDEAIGELLHTLDELRLRERTLLVLSSDHGETLSSAHQDKLRGSSNFEETVRVPIVLSLPGVLPEGREVKARVRTIDVAPTVAELLGLERSGRRSGVSLMPLVHGEKEPDERVVLSEGRGTRAILAGKWRLIAREGAPPSDELFDLDEDPGERHDLARERPEVVAEMRARLEAAKKNVPVAGTHAAAQPDGAAPDAAPVHLRFAGAGRARRISGTITASGPRARVVAAAAVGGAPESVRTLTGPTGARIEFSMTTVPDGLVGVDFGVEPPAAAVAWELYVDDVPLAASHVFAGPFGFAAPSLAKGLTTDDARALAYSPAIAEIDPQRDDGVFVTRARPGLAFGPSRALSADAVDEMARVLREWGNARAAAAAAAAASSAHPARPK